MNQLNATTLIVFSLLIVTLFVVVAKIAACIPIIKLWKRNQSPSPEPEVVDTTLYNQWLELKNPLPSITYKNNGMTRDKNGCAIVKSRFCSEMYIRINGGIFCDVIGVELYPVRKLIYTKRRSSELRPWGSQTNGVPDTTLARYEPVTDKKIINKLDCVIENYEKSILDQKQKVKDDILKATLSHKCKR